MQTTRTMRIEIDFFTAAYIWWMRMMIACERTRSHIRIEIYIYSSIYITYVFGGVVVAHITYKHCHHTHTFFPKFHKNKKGKCFYVSWRRRRRRMHMRRIRCFYVNNLRWISRLYFSFSFFFFIETSRYIEDIGFCFIIINLFLWLSLCIFPCVCVSLNQIYICGVCVWEKALCLHKMKNHGKHKALKSFVGVLFLLKKIIFFENIFRV